MASPIREGSVFSLGEIPIKEFYLLGNSSKNRGVLHTIFLSNEVSFESDFTCSEFEKLNGFCSYSFVYSMGGLCGLVLASPVEHTLIKGFSLIVGSETNVHTQNNIFVPLGILVMESPDSNSTILVSLDIKSSLLVNVDQ